MSTTLKPSRYGRKVTVPLEFETAPYRSRSALTSRRRHLVVDGLSGSCAELFKSSPWQHFSPHAAPFTLRKPLQHERVPIDQVQYGSDVKEESYDAPMRRAGEVTPEERVPQKKIISPTIITTLPMLVLFPLPALSPLFGVCLDPARMGL